MAKHLFHRHIKGCSPFTPCRNCNVVLFLRRKIPNTRVLKATMSAFDGRNLVDAKSQEEFDHWLKILKRNQIGVFLETTDYQAIRYLRDGGSPLLFQSVSETKMSTRLQNCLKNGGYESWSDLVFLTEEIVWRTPNLGNLLMSELKLLMKEKGLAFYGFNISGASEVDLQRNLIRSRS